VPFRASVGFDSSQSHRVVLELPFLVASRLLFNPAEIVFPHGKACYRDWIASRHQLALSELRFTEQHESNCRRP